ncbi:regulatory protein RecX [Leifsonia sp. H3M29-4]|uniref:regulatory protein RecX n=1 Tax=Salinibacterium metalliresistens TaxID=3031321 RepID=UPI0023DC61FA|nr:regulatory protein RecX [Salinibacterium metalliresistens]MDF1478972.1 regulatory protein RecX [Salinibacterium metalliresistens]
MSDGERLAPVTWLFGSPQPADSGEPSPSARLATARAALNEAEAESVADPVPAARGSFARISNVSMHALARRGVSSREMHDLLLAREFEEADIVAEIDRLESVGLLDDGLLAETLVRTLRERKGLGRAALVGELKRRKLHPDAIEAALAVVEGDDELDRAIAIAERRAPQLRSYDAETAKRRLGAFLMRKGYSGSVVSTAVARALEPSGPRFR